MSEFSRDEKPADFLLPESVKNWFTHIYTHMISGNVAEMARLYDREFSNLTNNYFKQTSWPEPQAIEILVDNDASFLLLYKQIYFRHMFSKLQPTMDTKVESWKNYCAIFDGILDDSLELEALPSQWIFDIVGEFVYQYQSFCQYRAKVASKSDNEVSIFLANQSIWDTTKVLNYLHALVRKSKIVELLKNQADAASVKGVSDTLKELGYFSLICLSRAHVLYGDYYTALKLLEPIDFFNKRTTNAATAASGQPKKLDLIYEKSASCHVSVLYHMGFAQLMLEDFASAIRSFSTLILQVHRNRNYYSRFADSDQLHKMSDKALALLTMTLYLCPGHKVNDQIHTMIREKYQDKQLQFQKENDQSVFSEMFAFACPKFILPACTPVNSKEEMTTRVNELVQLQIQLFVELVKRQLHVPALRSYVKLYRSIDLSKLARFRALEPEQLRNELVHYKNKIHQLENPTGSASLHFYLDDQLVFVDEETNLQRSSEFFVHHIMRFARIVDECAAVPATATSSNTATASE